ncbi:hypothetical protein HDU67_000709 [Dinochytrium kinnereticum]|nr:hypothetical protein HDU67_000709 [Dinochytrium kinnereticum]
MSSAFSIFPSSRPYSGFTTVLHRFTSQETLLKRQQQHDQMNAGATGAMPEDELEASAVSQRGESGLSQDMRSELQRMEESLDFASLSPEQNAFKATSRPQSVAYFKETSEAAFICQVLKGFEEARRH